VTYEVIIGTIALKQLKSISDHRVRRKIQERIDRLSNEPEKQGKPLIGELGGYHSLRAVGQRYRIIYKIDGERVTVFIVALGIRREGSKDDVYALARKLLRLRLLEPE
jgi:mRNA interferase RelE/StbE